VEAPSKPKPQIPVELVEQVKEFTGQNWIERQSKTFGVTTQK